jgi:translation initiation factor IF-3
MAPSTQLKALLMVSSITAMSAFVHTTTPFTFKPTFTSTSTSTSLAAQRRGRPRGPVRTIEIKPPMNDEIQAENLRVSVPNYTPTKNGLPRKDEVLGVMTKADALAKAKELGGLDVILINDQSEIPVVKIVDWSKYRYEKEKKEKEVKKNSKTSEVKEIKMSYKIDVHDYGVRIKSASKFIQQGNRVKCTVQFKGREQQHDRLGYELLDKLAEDLTKICTMEGKPKREGRFLFCIMSPRPEVTKAMSDKKRADEKMKKQSKLQDKERRLNKDGSFVEDDAVTAADLNKDDDDDDDDVNDADAGLDDDDDDDDDSSLDELLGASDAVTDDLFN